MCGCACVGVCVGGGVGVVCLRVCGGASGRVDVQ